MDVVKSQNRGIKIPTRFRVFGATEIPEPGHVLCHPRTPVQLGSPVIIHVYDVETKEAAVVYGPRSSVSEPELPSSPASKRARARTPTDRTTVTSSGDGERRGTSQTPSRAQLARDNKVEVHGRVCCTRQERQRDEFAAGDDLIKKIFFRTDVRDYNKNVDRSGATGCRRILTARSSKRDIHQSVRNCASNCEFKTECLDGSSRTYRSATIIDRCTRKRIKNGPIPGGEGYQFADTC